MRRINLLPEELIRAETRRIMRNSLIVSLVVVAVILTVIHLVLTVYIGALESVRSAQIADRDDPEIVRLRRELHNLALRCHDMLSSEEVFVEFMGQQFPWEQLLKIIGDIAQERVWLLKLSMDNRKRVWQMDGHALNTQVVSEFMLELRRLPIFESVNLASMQKGVTERGTEVTFNLICNLK